MVNTAMTVPGLLNPSRYIGETLHTDAPLRYFDEPIRSQLYGKVQRLGPDLDGQIGFDLAGRLSGNWFHETLGTPIAFAYDTYDPTQVRIAVGVVFPAGVFSIGAGEPLPLNVTVASGLVRGELAVLRTLRKTCLTPRDLWPALTAVRPRPSKHWIGGSVRYLRPPLRIIRETHSLALIVVLSAAPSIRAREEPGKRVSLGPFALQTHCSGRGGPVAVVETGLGDFAFDWALVQQRVERFTRICTYDRGGYGSSDVGPLPRTLAQLNLELHYLLRAAGEKPPFVLVGHSFGGAVARSYAARYGDEVAGMLLVESVAEHQPLVFGGKSVLLRESATGRPIPDPRLEETAQPSLPPQVSKQQELPALYTVLPTALQELHREFAGKPSLEIVENSQREWSSEYYAEWHRHPQRELLRSKPLIVITRAESGYDPSPNYAVDQVDGQRLRAQTELLSLSSNSLQIVLPVGHNMHLEAPDAVAAAIRVVATAARTGTPLVKLAGRQSPLQREH